MKQFKILLIALLLITSEARAESKSLICANAADPVYSSSADEGKTSSNVHLRSFKAAYQIGVRGILKLNSTNCGGQQYSAIQTRFTVKQNGRGFEVRFPSGLRLTGFGNRNGFRVTGNFRNSNYPNIVYFHELTAGPVRGGYANFRLNIIPRDTTSGASCSATYSGSLKVG